jgi:hypothetical protein
MHFVGLYYKNKKRTEILTFGLGQCLTGKFEMYGTKRLHPSVRYCFGTSTERNRRTT